MIHQHFKLVDLFTACDNIILGEKFEFDFKGEADKIKNETNDDAKSKFLAGLKYIARRLGRSAHMSNSTI